jgi:hypothetical protein
MPSKAELSRTFEAPVERRPRTRLWCLMQVHQYGQCIVAELLGPNKQTAQSLFHKRFNYTKVNNGRFFVAELHYPGRDRVKGTYLEYTLDMGAREIRQVKPITLASSPSPFPINPRKPVGPAPRLSPINAQPRASGLYQPPADHPSIPYRGKRSPLIRQAGPTPFQTVSQTPAVPVTVSVTKPRRPTLPPRKP